MIKGKMIKGRYFDSVRLMVASKRLKELDGVIDAYLVMGSGENIKLLKTARLYVDAFEEAGDTDLLLAVRTREPDQAAAALDQAEEILRKTAPQAGENYAYDPKSINGAVAKIPGANLALISVAGKYAAAQARQALEKGLHVMIFSDHVSIEDELELKLSARKQGLLVMGPDCGTAIINGKPLAFANQVAEGDIGIVAASGTGLQEVSSLISQLGGGISQALGTGGRDVKREVGGIMFLEALHALENDEQTKTIVLISKPPDPAVLDKILARVQQSHKKIVTAFMGADDKKILKSGAIPARTLEESAYLATTMPGNHHSDAWIRIAESRKISDREILKMEMDAKTNTQKYLRGLFSGGTFCTEAQLVLRDIIQPVYSNIPIRKEHAMEDAWQSRENCVIDLGDDVFTVGRLHPMIDYTTRNRMILEESKNPETAVLLLDVVLGYGAHKNPEQELGPVIKQARTHSPGLSLICSVTGTDMDLQVRSRVVKVLKESGAVVADSNAHAGLLAGAIIRALRR